VSVTSGSKAGSSNHSSLVVGARKWIAQSYPLFRRSFLIWSEDHKEMEVKIRSFWLILCGILGLEQASRHTWGVVWHEVELNGVPPKGSAIILFDEAARKS
jgi:hypothetical protein